MFIVYICYYVFNGIMYVCIYYVGGYFASQSANEYCFRLSNLNVTSSNEFGLKYVCSYELHKAIMFAKEIAIGYNNIII